MKQYIIKKGKHKASGFHFGLTFKKSIKFQAKFHESCLYNLGNNDNYDINKLYGFSTTIFHHKQSARIGWRCIDGENIEILTYSYNDSNRDLTDSEILGDVKPNELFQCEITDNEDHYLYKFYKIKNDKFEIVSSAIDKKQKDWFLFHYILYFYFGGNNTAPHDMKAWIKKI